MKMGPGFFKILCSWWLAALQPFKHLRIQGGKFAKAGERKAAWMSNDTEDHAQVSGVYNAPKLSVFTTPGSSLQLWDWALGQRMERPLLEENEGEKLILHSSGALCGQSSGSLITGIESLGRGKLWHCLLAGFGICLGSERGKFASL